MLSVISLDNSISDSIAFRDLRFVNVNWYIGKPPRIDDIDTLKFRRRYTREYRLGEIGCRQSHLELAEQFLQSEADFHIVLEDDAVFDSRFIEWLRAQGPCNKDEPTLILLGHSKTTEKNLFIQRLQQPLFRVKDVSGELFGRNTYINKCGSVAYCMNRSGAAEFLRVHNTNNFCLIDDYKIFKDERSTLEILHPLTPLVYENLNTPSSVGNTVKIKHTFSLTTLYSIIKIQFIKFLFPRFFL